MSSSLQTKADEYQAQALGKELGNLSAKITMIPMEFAKVNGQKVPDAAIETLVWRLEKGVGRSWEGCAKESATEAQSQMTELAKDVANLKHGRQVPLRHHDPGFRPS